MREEPGTVGPGEEPDTGAATPAPDAAAAAADAAMPAPETAPVADDGAPASPEPAGIEGGFVAGEGEPSRGLRGRVLSFRIRLPRTRRGLFAILLIGGALAVAFAWTGVTLIHWTETADFCGRCHQMGPELAAYESGPHQDVTCGECHVEPGVQGWVKAKINGTKQLVQVITGLYPQPIPPPDHDALPSVEGTCLHCHSLDRLQTATLVARTSFTEDEANTRQFIGLMIRPVSGDVFDVNRSVHWHVLREIDFRTPEENAEKIDWVAVNLPDGSVREFIAQDRIGLSREDVTDELEAIKTEEAARVMDCLQCHNRVGHPIPNPRKGLDYELTETLISPDLPYVKREGMRILWASYPNEEAAFAEIDKLSSFYELEYPDVAATMESEIAEAEARMKGLYRQTATPEMKVTAASYPDFLGHLDFPGCFRCHDGGHYLVENGAATSEVIPATCDTCHTYPQIGPVASMPLGEQPETHDDPLYVFNHKDVATSVDPGGQSCGQCHARDYCANCHDTGAITVNHDEMMTNHAESIRVSGNQSCAYCHQPVYCARCHGEEQVLPVTTPTNVSGNPANAPAGIRWPLVASGPAAGQAAP